MEDFVQVVYTNLVKAKNPKTTTTCNTNKPVEFAGVFANGLVHHFNATSLFEKEPDNNLMNIHVGNYKKRVNFDNHTIEYLESLPDFGLVVDYINGYDYKNFEKVFQTDYARYEDFRIMLSKLGFKNLLANMDELYPLLNINGVILTVSAGYINSLEPGNKLFALDKQQSRNVYVHFRDRDFFNLYFRNYLLGKKSLQEVVDIGTIGTIGTIGIWNTSDSKLQEYSYSKLEDDMKYYGLNKLLTALSS